MRIPGDFIDDIISQTDIVQLIREYVHLTQRGHEFVGLCPFHIEKSPSFSVSVEKKVYHCFGCKAGGGVINFVMEAEGLNYVGAIEYLANRVGLPMPTISHEDNLLQEKREKILKINKLAAHFFVNTLYSNQGAEAMSYLTKRKLTVATLRHFGVGFAPDGWDTLINHMAKQGVTSHDLVEAGLAAYSSKTGKIYDSFRNRIIFPIISQQKEVIGFGGRVMDDTKPKYINSPDTVVYSKNKNLYGLNFARKTKGGAAILTEGYMDVIALHQAGFDGALSSSGTAFTENQAVRLKQYFKSVVIVFDNDEPGRSATRRAIPLLTKVGLEVRVIELRGAKDPDEFIKEHKADSFAHLIRQGLPHNDYLLKHLTSKYDLDDNGDRVKFMAEASKFLAEMESSVQREIYATKVAEYLAVSKDSILLDVTDEMERQKRQQKQQFERAVISPSLTQSRQGNRGLYESTRAARGEEGLLRVCFLDNSLLGELEDFTSEVFSVPLLGKVFDTIKQWYQENRRFQLAHLTGYVDGVEMSLLAQILSETQDISTLQQAMTDYLAVMEEEYEKRSLTGDDRLSALQ